MIRFDLVWLAIRILAESTLISPNVPFHLAGFFVVSGRISSKTAQMIGCFFLLILFFFASSIILSFRSCVDLLNTAILLYSVYYYGPRNDQSGNIHAFEFPWSMLRFHFNGFCLMNGLVLTAVQFTLGCQSSYVVELACSFHYSLPLDY